VRRNPLNGSNELIAILGNRANVGWVCRIVLESGANLRDAEVQPALEIHEGLLSPDGFAQVVSRDDLIGTLDKTGEDLGGLRLQTNENALTAELEGGCVKLKETKAEPAGIHVIRQPFSHDFEGGQAKAPRPRGPPRGLEIGKLV
jgi:hypothetical protein